MFQSVLVPLDGSAFGEQALPWAVSVARRAGARLHLLHVHRPVMAAYPELEIVDEHLETELRQRHQDYLGRLAERLGGVVPVDFHVAEGDIPTGVREEAARRGCDLVVMTTHARGPFGRLWLGSVTDDLVRDLHIPLLLVHPGEQAADPGQDVSLRHLLLPLDGSPLAEQILEPATDLGSLWSAAYTLLRVIRPVLAPVWAVHGGSIEQLAQGLMERTEVIHDQLRAEAQKYLDSVAGKLRARGLAASSVVLLEEQPAVAILHKAQPPACDLVALETHGRRGLARFFLGSVADKVIRGSPVPVLVHRPR